MDLLSRVQNLLFQEVDILSKNLNGEMIENKVFSIIRQIEKDEKQNFLAEEVDKVISVIKDELLGYSILTPLIADPNITEIMINGPYQIYIEIGGKKRLTGIRFANHEHLMRVLQKMLSYSYRRVDEMNPFTDFSLPDGSRVNVIIPPVSIIGPVITIRKFLKKFKTIDDLVPLGTLNQDMAEFLKAAMAARLNIVFSGATGAGKTTTLSVLLNSIDPDERVVAIEDTAELVIDLPHVVRLEARFANIEGKGSVTIRDLFVNSLRMRPDRIIIGEVRGEEALDMIQAISSGHRGSLGVLHAESPMDAVARLQTMIVIYHKELPVEYVRSQIASGIDLIIQHERMKDGTRRITYITELIINDRGQLEFQDIYRFKQESISKEKIEGHWLRLGKEPNVFEKMRQMGIEPKMEWVM